MVDSPATSTGRALFLRLFLISVACLFAACQTPRYTEKDWDVPLTLRTVGPAYADYVLEVADTNRDRKVTYVEWMNAAVPSGPLSRLTKTGTAWSPERNSSGLAPAGGSST